MVTLSTSYVSAAHNNIQYQDLSYITYLQTRALDDHNWL